MLLGNEAGFDLKPVPNPNVRPGLSRRDSLRRLRMVATLPVAFHGARRESELEVNEMNVLVAVAIRTRPPICVTPRGDATSSS